MSNGDISVYTIITRDYGVVRKLSGLPGHKIYIIVLYPRNTRSIGPLLGQLKRYYNVNYKKGEPIIL